MGKNWYDPKELARENAVYAAWVLVLAGVATWDVLKTLPFDWSIINGKRKWRWPMVFYFADRIFMLIHIYAYVVNLNALSEIDCDTVVWLSKITDFLGTCTSSIILVLRTTAVWHQDKRITIPLAILCLVQVLLWTQTMRYSKSVWNPQRKNCQIISTSPVPLLVAVWSFTMTLDFIVLVLCAVRVWRSRKYGGIGPLLLRDGIAYFAAAFLSNLVQVVLAGLALNPIMNIIALPFTLVVSVIAATTVFRNVFTMFDAFSGESDQNPSHQSHSAPHTGPIVTFGGTGRTVGLSRGRSTTGRSTKADHYPPSRAGSSIRAIEVHKTVDIDIERDADFDNVPYSRDSKAIAEADDSRSSLTEGEEKSHAL